MTYLKGKGSFTLLAARTLIINSVLAGVLAGTVSCGKAGTNVADCEAGNKSVPCSERTRDEEIRRALDDGDLASAVTHLEEAIAEEPENYNRYSLLGAAYAAVAGFDIFNVVQAQFGGSSSIFDVMKNFLPDPVALTATEYDTSLGNMKKSIDILTAIPAEKRSQTSGERYATSASLQLTLYQSAYSIMYINKFAYTAESGSNLDIAKLESMSDADAEAILANLAAAAAVQQGEQGQGVSTAVGEAQAAIDATEGATTKEKLVNYMKAKNGS